MTLGFNQLPVLLLTTIMLVISSAAQKVTVGYDKSINFSNYASYTWTKPETSPTRPMLYFSITATIDSQLKTKGLVRMESDGDLILTPAGGMEFGFGYAAGTPILPTYSGAPPTINSTMWTGAGGGAMSPAVPEGTLMLNFIDRGANKIVWTGTVKQKLDLQDQKKSLELINKGITKLLDSFPPKNK